MTVLRAAGEGTRTARRPALRLALLGVGLLVLVLEAVAARGYLGAAFRALGRAHPLWVVLAVFSTAVSMQCFARTQRRLLIAADPGLRARVSLARMVGLAYSANALSVTLPAGSAVSIGYVIKRLRSWGSTTVSAGFAVVGSGVLSSATFLALAALVGVGAGSSAGVGWIAAALLVAVALVAVRRRVIGRLENLLRRVSARAADALRASTDSLAVVRPRGRDWSIAAATAGGNWVADLACLVATTHAVGVSVGPATLLAAYLAGMSASSIALLPGGLGVVELAMIAVLHAGGAAGDGATASVLLYRLISCAFVVTVGWVVWARTALHQAA